MKTAQTSRLATWWMISGQEENANLAAVLVRLQRLERLVEEL